jgi:hypothetical protein
MEAKDLHRGVLWPYGMYIVGDGPRTYGIQQSLAEMVNMCVDLE